MTDTEVRKLLRQMKNDDSQRAFHRFYDLTYDRLFRIAYYFCKREEWAQEIVLDVFMAKATSAKAVHRIAFESLSFLFITSVIFILD